MAQRSYQLAFRYFLLQQGRQTTTTSQTNSINGMDRQFCEPIFHFVDGWFSSTYTFYRFPYG